MRPHILLGADSLLTRRSGVARVVLEIARGLRTHPEIASLSLLAGERVLETAFLDRLPAAASGEAGASRLQTLAARLPGAAALRGGWRRRRLNAAARRLGGPTLYHEPNLIARPFDGPTVVAVNDLSWRIDGAFHPAERVAFIERRLPATLAQATRFVAISSFTADEMVRHLGITRDRIDVVPLAVSPAFQPLPTATAAAVLGRYRLEPGRYVLSVSTREPRKNFDRLLAAHAALPPALRQRHPLVIAGSAGWGDTLAGVAAQRALASGQLRLLGHVSDADLVALYGQATMFAFPSLYEGFGFPVIEAMASGAPVLAAATTAVGETAGDAAWLVDPLDVDAITGGLRAMIEDPALAARLREAGHARAARFTWERTIAGLIASWQRALAD